MKTKLILSLMLVFTMKAGAIYAQTNSTELEEGGTGPYKAAVYEVDGFAEHTVFAPKDLSKFNAKNPLPVLVWGNGGCANSPRGHEKFLNDLASYGYIVLATGVMPAQDAPRGMGGGMGMGGHTKNICIAGMSCGGLQALFNCFDKRVTSIMICNSGLLNDGGNSPMGGMPSVPKDKLKDIHCPIMYMLGGESDIAYANGMDDFKRITHVPAIAVNLPVGHGGTYNQPHGGEFAIVARAWLDWQLKGDKEASKMFVGDSPAILQRPSWTLEKNAKVK